MSVVIVLCLGMLMHMLGSFQIGGAHPSGGTSLALGYLLLTGLFVGRIFGHLRLPKLTGYIFTGFLVGPAVLGLLTEAAVVDLKLVNGLAVVLIALTAGAELEFRSMRPLLRTVGWITLTAVVGTALVLAATVYLASGLLPFLDGLSASQRIGVSGVLGIVMAAQSPAVVVALTNETGAEGPLTRTVLGVVVLADLVVVVLFACTSSVVKGAFGGTIDLGRTVEILAWEILGSLGAGAVLGALLAFYLRRIDRGTGLFLLAVAFAIAEVGARLALDPLLVALAAGVLIRNATRAGDRLLNEIEGFSLPVYVLFFAIAGANLHLDVLRQVGVPVVIFVVVRAASMFAGARLGARVAGAPDVVRRYCGFGLLPQAGLALALATLFARTFPEFGEAAAMLLVGVVAVNEIVAPVAYRFVLVRSGEFGRRSARFPGGEEAGAAGEPSASAEPLAPS